MEHRRVGGVRRGALAFLSCAAAAVLLLAVTIDVHPMHTTGLMEDSWAWNMHGDAGGPNMRVKSMDDVNRVVDAANRWKQQRQAMLLASGGATETSLRARTLQLSEGDLDEFFVSDFFEYLSRNCCRSLYFPKEAQKALPRNLPGGVNGVFAQRLRDFVGERNSLIFNGADADTASFINKYFGTQLATTDVNSGFKMSRSLEVEGDPGSPLAYPEKLEEELPQKLYPQSGMTAINTATLPPATAVVFNNFPRSPTGSPMFISKYCQIENPYVQDGTRITVSPPDCTAAAKDLGSGCSCGHIAFVGWDWEKGADNIWDTSSINAQVIAEYMGAGGKVPEMKSRPNPTLAKSVAKTPASQTEKKASRTEKKLVSEFVDAAGGQAGAAAPAVATPTAATAARTAKKHVSEFVNAAEAQAGAAAPTVATPTAVTATKAARTEKNLVSELVNNAAGANALAAADKREPYQPLRGASRYWRLQITP